MDELNIVQEWIWVKKKMPEDGKPVIAYCGWNGDKQIAVVRNNKWYLHWDNVTELRCISHWMPLPEKEPNIGEGWRLGA